MPLPPTYETSNYGGDDGQTVNTVRLSTEPCAEWWTNAEWLTNSLARASDHDSDSFWDSSDPDTDISGAARVTRVPPRHEETRQRDSSPERQVPSTISRKDVSAAGSIDLQMLAERPNKLTLAGQDNGQDHGRRSTQRAQRIRRQGSAEFVDKRPGTSPGSPPSSQLYLRGGPPPPSQPGWIGRASPPPPPPPPPPMGPIPFRGPESQGFPPQNSLLGRIQPGGTLRTMLLHNWNDPQASEPYRWRDRLRVTGRSKSESSLDHYRKEEAKVPLGYHNLPPSMSKRDLVTSWRHRGSSLVQTKNHTSNQAFPNLGAELGRAAETSLRVDLLDDQPQSLFISYLLDIIEQIRYERNFMESLLTRPIYPLAPPPPPAIQIVFPEGPAKKVPRQQILHRVFCIAPYHTHHQDAMFEDRPVKTFSEESGDLELGGELAVLDLGSYCAQNPDIAFITFKEYQCVQGERPAKRPIDSKHRVIRIRRASHNSKISPRAERMLVPSGVLERAIVRVASCEPPRPSDQRGGGGVNEKVIEMDAPYLFLYHHRAALRDISEDKSDPMTEHILVLLDFLDSDWEAEYHEADDQFELGIVTNKHIDKLFRPNNIVIDRSKESPRAYVIASWPSRRQEHLVLNCWSWMYNGIDLRPDHTHLRISLPLPDGFTTNDLQVCPISKVDSSMIEQLKQRGKKFWSMKERYFGCYSGFDIKKTKDHHHTRVVIDIQTYSRMHPDDEDLNTDSVVKTGSPIGPWPSTIPWENELDDVTAMLLPTIVYGFWLQEKTWLRLDIAGIHPIEWNKRAFDRLVLDPKTKELITALVQVRIATGRAEDIIEGKGNGLMILLHGGPGTGKTLTAESVAEIAEKPLYRVTCGDVGTKVIDVERYLQTVLYLGKTWNCVLLLDEADVFLEERGIADLERNSLVSVFLRILEYYDGILIMTSNRVGIFDEAFKSRIQVSLHYEDLTKGARRTIWNNFIAILEEAGADVNVGELESHLDDLAAEELNGRQIRNAMTTARQLAVYRKERLDWEHLDQVLKTARDFNRYLKTVQGHSDKQWAREQRLR